MNARTTRNLFGISALAALLGCASGASALPLIGNFPIGDVFNTSTIDPNQKKAVSFTTPDEVLTLERLELWLIGFDDGDSPDISILLDDAGAPANSPDDPVIATFGDATPAPTGEGGVGVFSFPALGDAELLANTTYWLLLDIADEGAYNWVGLEEANPFTGVADFEAYAFSSDGGESFQPSGIQNSFQLTAVDPPVEPPVDLPPPGPVPVSSAAASWQMLLLMMGGGLAALRSAIARRSRGR